MQQQTTTKTTNPITQISNIMITEEEQVDISIISNKKKTQRNNNTYNK